MMQDIDIRETSCPGERSAARCEICHWWIARVGCCCAISPLRSRDPSLVCAEFKPTADQNQPPSFGADFPTDNYSSPVFPAKSG